MTFFKAQNESYQMTYAVKTVENLFTAYILQKNRWFNIILNDFPAIDINISELQQPLPTQVNN